MSKHLVITAVGDDRPGIVNDLTRHLLDSGCNILDSRMTILGGEFALILLLSGNWSSIAKVEETLPRVADKLGLTLNLKRTERRSPRGNLLSYHVDALAIDQPGLVHRVADFFSSRGINIETLNTDSYNAAHTGTPMFAISMTVNIPSAQSIAQIREQYLDFCDSLNMDGMMEPVRA
ncbi:glycine cleavage system protein R [Candidatus Tenderia electrophaga]|jgi:glycine cleavage system transcriptional repressor|uniref:Glycine cleavage system transcriptional repressor n=1 Tax=Candidatus Tenderia electrophaga TaxID=1748243 RepID=A0A0S2TBB7_9GAMM|nr:glycine cleavage system protein R [Candidatus Tenderia electrophaga]